MVVTFKDSVEDFIERIDHLRSQEIYKHENCAGSKILHKYQLRENIQLICISDACQARGCGNVWSSDGLWKLGYPIW